MTTTVTVTVTVTAGAIAQTDMPPAQTASASELATPSPTPTALPIATPAGPTSNPVALENKQPGSTRWRVPWNGYRVATDANEIKGYASAVSVNKGQHLTFYVAVNPVQAFSIDIFRVGWYGGLGARLLQHVESIAGIQQPACPVVDRGTSLLACNWSPSYTLTVPLGWTDGIYLAVLSNAQKYQNYVPFVVRDDSRQAALLYVMPVNTYQAYNNWGGKSLYSFNSSNGARAYTISFDRPYAGDGSGDFLVWEVYLVRWLEQRGYDIAYSTDVDVQTNPGRLIGAEGVLFGGHSEYWTKGMFDAAQAARDAGVSLAFFGSNDAYWQARYEASPSGVANRALVCYKVEEAPDPTDPITAVDPALTTSQWRDRPVNRPEQTLIGVQFSSQTGRSHDDTAPYVVVNSASWVYAGTGFADGASIPGIVGYEADRSWPTLPKPSNRSYTLLADSPYVATTGKIDRSNSVVYQAPSGAWVFASGTESWSWALGRPGYANAGLQQATANLLNRFIVARARKAGAS